MAAPFTRLRERAEELTGIAVRPAADMRMMEAEFQQMAVFRDEAEDLALASLDYLGGRPHEVRADRRRELSQRSRVAYIKDPLAGAEGDMRANFAFGRGVSKPTAKDPEVQTVVDRFWTDPVNQKKLTSYEAQRLRSNDLLAQANLFATYFEENGRIRAAFIDADLVTDVVVSEEDDELPLWYVTRKKKREWDFNRDSEKPMPFDSGPSGLGRAHYYPHWRNVEMMEADAEKSGRRFSQKPPRSKIEEGRVEHFRINRIGRTQFGVPPWARVLRYFSAMNQFNEARVSMAQAAASIIAKRVIRGGPKGVVKAASNVLSQAGELAQARFGRRADRIDPTGPGTNPSKGFAPPPPGSIWTENESDSLQAMNLNSGGPAAAADQQILMSPISAASQFGPHYYGNLNDAGLASATTVELPTMMNVSSWQETFEGMYKWYINRSIEAAVHSGQLGGVISESTDSDGRPLTALVYEEDREEMEKRTGKDLSYSFQMPYPGRRNLPDVINVATAAVEAYDPEGKNPWMRRYFMEFLLQTLEVEDPAKAIDTFLPLPDGMETAPEELAVLPLLPQEPEGGGGEEGGDEEGGAGPVPRSGKPSEQRSDYGERRRSSPASRDMGGRDGGQVQEAAEAEADELARALAGDADREFENLLADPSAFIHGRPPAGKADLNGHAAPTA